MNKILLFVLLSWTLLSIAMPVAAQKSAPLDQQSQEVVRFEDSVQVSATTKEAGQTTTSAFTSTGSSKQSTSSATRIDAPTGYAPNIIALLNWLLSFVIVLALLLAFANFIMAGIEWITSGGDKSKTESARSRITHVFIGVIILSAAYAIIQFVAYILGFESLNDALTSITRIQ